MKNIIFVDDDPNVVASFHCYTPILFTHQGASFMGPEYQTVGLVFPGPPIHPVRPVTAARNIDWMRDWFDAYNSKGPDNNPGGPKAILDYFDRAQHFVENPVAVRAERDAEADFSGGTAR